MTQSAAVLAMAISMCGSFAKAQCLEGQERTPKIIHVHSAEGLTDALKRPAPGDLILLAPGNYGQVELNGSNQQYVTLRSEDEGQAVFSRVLIKGAAWRLQNLTVLASSQALPPTAGDSALVKVMGASNVTIERTHISMDMAKDFWVHRKSVGPMAEPLLSGIVANNVSCLRVSENVISNVFNGVTAGGDPAAGKGFNIEISNNIIRDFGADGIDHYGSSVDIFNNYIYNAKNICDAKCVHPDGIQGWTYNLRPGIVNKDVKIHDNIVISNFSPEDTLNWGGMQGITIFDGDWENVQIENNLILVGTWHGLSLYGARHSRIIHNTVLSTDPNFDAWILISAKKGAQDLVPADITVSQNVTKKINIGPKMDRQLPGVTLSDNLQGATGPQVFKEFRADKGIFDFQPRKSARTLAASAGANLIVDPSKLH